GFTGSAIWHYVAMFPPVDDKIIQEGYADFADRWNPIIDVFDEVGVRFAHEVHPSEIAYDYWSPARLRPQFRSVTHGLAGARLRRVPVGFPRSYLSRGL